MASSAVDVTSSGVNGGPGDAPGKKDGEKAPVEETSVEAKDKSLGKEMVLDADTVKAPTGKKDGEEALAVKAEDKSLGLLDANKVKAPGIMERTMEEVEAVAEVFHEKLDLKGHDDENKAGKQERDGIFKRLLKKVGFK